MVKWVLGTVHKSAIMHEVCMRFWQIASSLKSREQSEFTGPRQVVRSRGDLPE